MSHRGHVMATMSSRCLVTAGLPTVRRQCAFSYRVAGAQAIQCIFIRCIRRSAGVDSVTINRSNLAGGLMNTAVYCIAVDTPHAEHIVGNLKRAGFSSNEISVLLPAKGATRDFAHEQHTKLPEGAAAGGAAGMGVGAILGWLAGIGTLAIPGIGPFIAAGPLMAALGGAAGVAAACAKSIERISSVPIPHRPQT